MRKLLLILAACALSGCGTPRAQLVTMTNEQICNKMVINPNTDYATGQQILMARNAACTPAQYDYIYRAQSQYQRGMAALGAYGMQMQANSYRQVAPVMRQPVTCYKVGYTVQCY